MKRKTATMRSGKAACACPTCGRPTTLYAFREQKPQTETEAYRKRIKNLVAQFELEGYDTYDRDAEVACAVAQIMAVEGSQAHLENILRVHMERLTAAQLMEAG